MDGVDDCSVGGDVGGQYDDGVSVAPENGTSATTTPVVDDAQGTCVDSFETAPAAAAYGTSSDQALRDELAAKMKEREELRPQIEKAREEALWTLPKVIPYGGVAAESAKKLTEAGKAVSNGDFEAVAKAFNDHSIESGETASPEAVERLLEHRLGSTAKDAAGVAEFALVASEAHDVYQTLRDYGALAKQDDALRFSVEEIKMKLDPKARFARLSTGGNKLSETGEGLVDKRGKPTQGRTTDSWGEVGRVETAADLEKIAGIRRRFGL